MKVAATPNPDLQQAIDYCQTALAAEWLDSLFPRAPQAVFTASVITHLMIYQRLHGNATLSEAVAELLRGMERLPDHCRITEQTLSANSGGYSRARTELPVAVAHQVADRMSEQQCAVYPPSFGRRRVFLFDGTTLTLPHTDELIAAFPPSHNQYGKSHWPIVRMVVAHELASGSALRPEYGPVHGSKPVDEVRLAVRMLPRLPPRSLVMGDSNFGIFAFVYGAYAAGHDALTRLTSKRFHALKKQAKAVGPNEWVLNWKPTRDDRRSHPGLPSDAAVRVHLHELVIDPTLTLYLAVTLEQPTSVWGELYRLRLRVETDIFDVKRTLKLDETRVKSVAMWEKEMCFGYVAYNLIIQVRRLAASYARVEPSKLSFSGTRSLVEQLLFHATATTAAEWEQLFERVLRGASQRKLPQRKNPQRSYPRTVISRRRKYPVRRRPLATSAPDPNPEDNSSSLNQKKQKAQPK